MPMHFWDVSFGDINAYIVTDKEGAEISVVPFEIKIYNGFDKRSFEVRKGFMKCINF